MTNRLTIGHLLLVVHWYQVPISKRFRDIRPQIPVHTQTHAKSDFIFCLINVLHWTDKNLFTILHYAFEDFLLTYLRSLKLYGQEIIITMSQLFGAGLFGAIVDNKQTCLRFAVVTDFAKQTCFHVF